MGCHCLLRLTILDILNLIIFHAQSCPTLCNLWAVTHQGPLSMAFPRQEYWSGLPYPPPPGDLPNLGIKSASPALQADSLPFEPPVEVEVKVAQFSSVPFSRSVMSNTLRPHERKHGEGNGTPLQYSCLENPIDGGAW